MKKLFLLSLLISLISPIKTFAGFPEGEKGYDLKKIEESFKLPCDEIGNDDCIARAFGVGACTWVFGIKNGKESKEALRIKYNASDCDAAGVTRSTSFNTDETDSFASATSPLWASAAISQVLTAVWW